MDYSTEIVYSVPISLKPERDGQSQVRRHPLSVKQLVYAPDQKITSFQDIWLNSQKLYGWQVKQGQQTVLKYESYEHVGQMARYIGSGLILQDLLTQIKISGRDFRFVGIFSKNRKEWCYADIANSLFNFQMVPLYDTLGQESIYWILEQTQIATCYVTDATLKSLSKLKSTKSLKCLIMLDAVSQEHKKIAEKLNLRIIGLEQLIAKGKSNPQAIRPVSNKDCFTLNYTSGSTSLPKGAIVTHENIVAICGALTFYEDIVINKGDKYLSYLPLPHVLQRIVFVLMTFKGGVYCFYGGDVQALKNDLALVQPDIFVSVPRLFNRFYDVIRGKFNQMTGFKKKLLDMALEAKLQKLRATGKYTHIIYDNLVFKKTKEAFGGKVRLMITGSAPLSAQTIEFLKVVSCCPLVEGYGQTQSTGASFLVNSLDRNINHVGGPIRSLQFKVVDIPQMNYFHTDLSQGINTPRGQICLRGPIVFGGYLGDQEKTKEAIDQFGWLHTGDVGMILPNGSLRIIDRKKNIFKLSQGEYVAPQKNVYIRAKGVKEVFLHGQSLESFTVAIIVPEEAYIKEVANNKNISGSFQQLCKAKQIRLQILQNLTKQGKAEGLTGFEQAKNVYLQPVSFVQSGCYTNTLKLKRYEAKRVFVQAIKQLYSQGLLK